MNRKMIVIIASILAFLVLIYIGIVVANNRIAERLENDLLAYPLPPRTELLDSMAIAGKVHGNGNGMQYFGEILVKSELSEAELKEYYAGCDANADSMDVIKQESPILFTYYDYRFDAFDENAACYRIELGIYQVAGLETSFWESMLNSDLRGH